MLVGRWVYEIFLLKVCFGASVGGAVEHVVCAFPNIIPHRMLTVRSLVRAGGTLDISTLAVVG